jgi:surface antigen
LNVVTKRSRKRTARALALLACTLGLGAGLPTASQALTLRWTPSADLFWAVNGSAIVHLFQNGQCTEWAANRRPDVLRQIIVGFIANDLARDQIESVPNLDARYWTQDASLVGIATGHKPRAGSLIVFQPGVMGAGSVGHIAYVTRVSKRSFSISEMNAPNPYRVSYRTLRMSDARRSGVGFVY